MEAAVEVTHEVIPQCISCRLVRITGQALCRDCAHRGAQLELAELRIEVERLRRENARLRAERDQ